MNEIPRKARKETLGEVNTMCSDSKSKRYHHSVSEHLQSVVGKAISIEDSKYQPCNMIKGSAREAVGHSFDSQSPMPRWIRFGRD